MTFHVPNQHRIRTGTFASSDEIGNCGAFWIPNRYRRDIPLKVIASDGDDGTSEHGWEHVSVSYPDRCPTWEEMCIVKSLFWDDEDAVMQLHPPRSQWVNNHRFCLHLWRPTLLVVPLPPAWMVGYAALGVLA